MWRKEAKEIEGMRSRLHSLTSRWDLKTSTDSAFQVRAVTNSGYTDWSQSIIRIAT